MPEIADGVAAHVGVRGSGMLALTTQQVVSAEIRGNTKYAMHTSSPR